MQTTKIFRGEHKSYVTRLAAQQRELWALVRVSVQFVAAFHFALSFPGRKVKRCQLLELERHVTAKTKGEATNLVRCFSRLELRTGQKLSILAF